MTNALKNFFLCSIIVLMYAPIVVLIAYSFNEAQYSMTLTHFSVKWYRMLMNNPILWKNTGNSFLLAFISSSVTTLLAGLCAIALYFYSFKAKKSLQKLMLLMIIVPDIMLAIGLLLLFNAMQLTFGFCTLLFAHISFSLPFALIVVQNRITSLDKNLLLVCQDLGAFDFFSCKTILLPLLSTALVSAWLLSFTLSFDDVLISYFVSGPSFQTLPLTIYSLIRTGIKPEINALCSIIFIISSVCAVLSYEFIRKD